MPKFIDIPCGGGGVVESGSQPSMIGKHWILYSALGGYYHIKASGKSSSTGILLTLNLTFASLTDPFLELIKGSLSPCFSDRSAACLPTLPIQSAIKGCCR